MNISERVKNQTEFRKHKDIRELIDKLTEFELHCNTYSNDCKRQNNWASEESLINVLIRSFDYYQTCPYKCSDEKPKNKEQCFIKWLKDNERVNKKTLMLGVDDNGF